MFSQKIICRSSRPVFSHQVTKICLENNDNNGWKHKVYLIHVISHKFLCEKNHIVLLCLPWTWKHGRWTWKNAPAKGIPCAGSTSLLWRCRQSLKSHMEVTWCYRMMPNMNVREGHKRCPKSHSCKHGTFMVPQGKAVLVCLNGMKILSKLVFYLWFLQKNKIKGASSGCNGWGGH